MSKIRTEIAKIVENISRQADAGDSSFSKIKRLAILVSATGSNCSQNFIDLVDELCDLDPLDTVEPDMADALKEMFGADQIIADSATDSENAELARFSLKDADKVLLIKKCDQLRKVVWAATTFDAPHRNRLLKRISAMELEVSKETGVYDVILGGIADFGEVAGKFGSDVKPLVDRMREIAGLVRKHTPEYDKLPAPDEIKKLPPPDE